MNNNKDIVESLLGYNPQKYDEREQLLLEIERLTDERDEVRRMWCEAEVVGNCLSVDDMYRRARAEANRRGWDCYHKDKSK